MLYTMLNYIKRLFSDKVKMSHEEELIYWNIRYLLGNLPMPFTHSQVKDACEVLLESHMFRAEDIEYVKYLIIKNKI